MTDKNFDACMDDILPLYDQILQEYAYEKIWSEISGKEQEILKLLAKNEDASVGDLREELKMESNNFNVFSSRIKEKGILTSNGYGKLGFTLPRFDVFIRNMY